MNGEDSCVRLSLKTCPICKTHVFDDMNTCYNCMYSFGSNPELEQRARVGSGDQIQAVTQATREPIKTDVQRKEAPKTVEMACIVEGGSHLEYSYDHYETPEDCIKEYETMLIRREREVVVAGAARSKNDGSPAIKAVSNSLFQEFLVEFSGFLRKFLLDREIGV